jgi:hypothetical protein
MIKTKLHIIMVLALIGFTAAPQVFAVNNFRNMRPIIRNDRVHFSTPSSVPNASPSSFPEFRQKLQNLKNTITSRMNDLKNKINSRAVLSGAQITGISGTTLTVMKDGKTYTVNTDGNTRLRRRFFGKANVAEMSVNDSVNIIGKWTDDAHTVIQSQQIRDMSIQKRFGIFVGTVTAENGNTLTVNTFNRGTQNVTVSGTTKYTDRRNAGLSLGDVQVGHRIRVKGMWDKTNNTITEVSEIKDYNLPVKASATPTPAPTAGPTAAPTVTPAPTDTPMPTVVPTATPTPIQFL